MEHDWPEVPPPPRVNLEGTEALVDAFAAASWQSKLAEIGKSFAAIQEQSGIAKLAESVRGSTQGIAALGLRTQQIQSDLARIKVPIYEPPNSSALDGAMAARRQRDAERDAAILATSYATAEVAQAVQALAAVNAQTLAEIATMRRDSRRILYWTAAGVLIALVALFVVALLR